MNRQTTGQIIGHIAEVLRGQAQPYTRPDSYSAIAKQPVTGAVSVGSLGLDGDEQGDMRYHGGLEKAVHAYPGEHYRLWRRELGPLPVLAYAGAFGENLSTRGVNEHRLCINDHIRIGSVELEISQGRQPCWKLNDRVELSDMSRRVQYTLRTGWYFRILRAGELQTGDRIELLARPWPEWPLARIMTSMFAHIIDRRELSALLDIPLEPRWRETIEQRLNSGKVEDWCRRLDGP